MAGINHADWNLCWIETVEIAAGILQHSRLVASAAMGRRVWKPIQIQVCHRGSVRTCLKESVGKSRRAARSCLKSLYVER